MDMPTMVSLVRRDLKDENASNQRWSYDELERAVNRAVSELSKYSPYQEKYNFPTVNGSAEIDIEDLWGTPSIDRVEFPIGKFPRSFVRFEVYADKIIMLDTKGDGSDCCVYWSTTHSIADTYSTVPFYLEDLVALGATAYAALMQSQYSTDKANYGGENVDRDFLYWAKGRLMDFEKGLKDMKKKMKTRELYTDHRRNHAKTKSRINTETTGKAVQGC